MGTVQWDARTERWIDAAIERHTRALTSSEFLKAVRALSVRYVERRRELAGRSPIDSAGKRAAFGGFYAPLHFLTVTSALDAVRAPDVSNVLDLGCGTGAAGMAWAVRSGSATIAAIDRDRWALDEARWNFHQIAVTGSTRRADLVSVAETETRRKGGRPDAVTLGWSVNELDDLGRTRLLQSLLALGARGTSVLVVEPISHAATPWWNEWATAFGRADGIALMESWDAELPLRLATLDEAAGFRRNPIAAKVLWLPGAR